MTHKAILALADGSYFEGEAFGATGSAEGEICFNTSMTGYQEILTDPSYAGQIVVMTYPEMGNYGINPEDVESTGIQVAGFIAKNVCETPSNWRGAKNSDEKGTALTLNNYLQTNNIPGLKGIDTRKLVRNLRDKGAQMGVLVTGDYSIPEVLARAKKIPSLNGKDLVKNVSTPLAYAWQEPEHIIQFNPLKSMTGTPLIIVLDFGVKKNILRILKSLGAEVKVVPANTTFAEIAKLNPDGILLSNGPGDPEAVTYALDTIKKLILAYPVFGICLGHQLLCLALGGKTYKLKFGHRGANHPIKHLPSKTVAITSQNHGFAVSAESLNQADIEITHINLNDNTVAGIRHKSLPLFSVQYHPEASPGPKDSQILFTNFMDSVGDHKQKKRASLSGNKL